MPFDNYFRSKKEKKRGRRERKASRARVKELQCEGEIELEMRVAGGCWWNFLNVTEEKKESEVREWRRRNAGYEFRVGSGLL